MAVLCSLRVRWVIVSAPSDCPPKEREAAGAIWAALKADGIEVYPAIVPVDLEHLVASNCMFSGLTGKPAARLTRAKVKIIIGRKPMATFKTEKPGLPGR